MADQWESELETGWSWLAGTVADNVQNGGAVLTPAVPEIGVMLQPMANNGVGWCAT
jgi:hypothetical protein